MSPPKVPVPSLLLLPASKRRPFALKSSGCTPAYLLLGRIISLFQKTCQHVHKVVSRNYRSPEHHWLCSISHWLSFTHAKKWCLSSSRFSVCIDAHACLPVCIWFCVSCSHTRSPLHTSNSPQSSVNIAGLTPQQQAQSSLLIWWLHTLLYCVWLTHQSYRHDRP